MVKGISRQVIVVQSPEPKMFEQAIFILREGSSEVSDEALLKEADRLIRSGSVPKKKKLFISGPIWACAGAMLTAAVWFIYSLLSLA